MITAELREEDIDACNVGGQQLPHFDREVLLHELRQWMRIRQYRREEFYTFLHNAKQRGVRILLEKSCSNDVSLRNHGWLAPGENIFKISRREDAMQFQSTGAVIETLVITEAWWKSLGQKKERSTFWKFAAATLANYGRVVFAFPFGKDGAIGHSDFNCRGYSMDASLPDSERLLGFQLQKGPSVIEVTACTKQPHNASKGPANEVHLIRTDPCSRYRSKFCVHQALVVNLDRRREKYETFKRRAWQTTQLRDGIDFSRFSAIDGKRLQPNLPAHLRKIFSLDGYNPPFERFRTNPYKDHGYRPGVLGCALSNMRIWADIESNAGMGDSDITLILEDDVDFVEGFLPMWRARLASIEDDPTWSWV